MKDQIFSDYAEAAKTAMYNFYGARPYMKAPDFDEENHVSNIARDIMLHRDKKLAAGSFTTAVLNNDLEAAIRRADITCLQHLPFLLHCKLNVRVS